MPRGPRKSETEASADPSSPVVAVIVSSKMYFPRQMGGSATPSPTATTSIDRYKVLGLNSSLSRSYQYGLACEELAFILKHAYPKAPKNLQSLIFQDTLAAFLLLPTMQTKSAIVAANSLLQRAESALPKQKKVLVVTEFKHAMVACKRRSKAQLGEEELPDSVQLPQDVVVAIFSFLDLHSLASAATVCRSWSVAAKENHLWETLYVDCFGESDRCSRIDSFRSSRTIDKENMHSESDIVNGISINWREAFKTVYQRLSSKKFTHYRGYCRHCNIIVWLDNTKCYNRHGGKSCESPSIDPVSMHQIIDYVLYDCPPSDSSSDSDSDSDYAAVSKLWNYFSS